MTFFRETTAVAGSPSVFLERDAELSALGQHLDAVVSGRAGIAVFVGGEAGVGKTALLREVALRRSPGVRLLSAGCEPLLAARPLGPFSDLGGELGGLDELVDGRGTPYEVASCLLEQIRGSGPTLLVIEDVHWADEGTLDVLRLLAPRVGDVAVLLVVSYRDDELGPWHPVRILIGELGAARAIKRMRLVPLSPSAVATMAEPFGADAAELYRRTAGNPFFVTELLAEGTGMPATVADAVLARAARLDPASRKALEAVAVAGSTAERWVLDRVVPGAGELLEDAVGGGLLMSSDESLSFRHELAREAILSVLGAYRQASLHRAVLEALRSPPWGESDLARLAHHAIGAADAEAVLEIVPRAARQASSRGAHREAAVLYEQAARFADAAPLEDRAALYGRMSREFLTSPISSRRRPRSAVRLSATSGLAISSNGAPPGPRWRVSPGRWGRSRRRCKSRMRRPPSSSKWSMVRRSLLRTARLRNCCSRPRIPRALAGGRSAPAIWQLASSRSAPRSRR